MQRQVDIWKSLHNASEDISAMLELAEDEDDQSILTEIHSSLADLDVQVAEAEFKALLSEKNDFSNEDLIKKLSNHFGSQSIVWSFSLRTQTTLPLVR